MLYQAYVHCTLLFTQWPRWPLLLSGQVKVLQVSGFLICARDKFGCCSGVAYDPPP